MKIDLKLGAAVLVALTLAACSKPAEGPPRLPTSPVSGVVQIDGKPGVMVEVRCLPEEGSSEIKHEVTAMTGEDGKFVLGTYEAGDGLPAGTYTLTFSAMEMGMTMKDTLKGRYADPKKSKHKATVTGDVDEKVDLGTIELSSK